MLALVLLPIAWLAVVLEDATARKRHRRAVTKAYLPRRVG